MEKREHDIFLDMASNPEASFDDLVTAGLNTKNTALQDKVAYEQDEWVKEQFKNQYGQFDQARFDSFYNNDKTYYNVLADAEYNESMKNQMEYHRDNIFVPIEQRREGPDFIEFQQANPYKITSSVHELGRVGQRTKSIDELAQSNKVLLNPTTAGENLENAQWGETPNDEFWGYFTDTLVMAQYDEAGTHRDPFTGQMVEHAAGDLKLDSNGDFYYEKLDGRSVYGRRVLNKMNVLTTDGSFWNQFDFFDSDDLYQKSVGGTILKNLALVGSMFIPYVGPWVAGLSIATQSAGLIGTLGKMLVDSDSPTFSELDGWSKSMSRSGAVTEYAQQNTWCWENMINLIGDVAGQLKEQRFIFEKVPYVFKGANMMSKEGQAAKLAELTAKHKKLSQVKIDNLMKHPTNMDDLLKASAELNVASALRAEAELASFIKGYNKIGEVLSKGYMTAVTVGDTYGEAKLAGATDLEATLLTLGYAAGEYAILNTGLGEWVLPELRAGRYKAKAIYNAITKQNPEVQKLYKQFGKQLTNISKEGKKEYTKKLFDIGKNIARAEYANGTKTMSATLAAGAGEGFEEVSEELLADFSKGCFDVVQWLQGDDTRINAFGYDFKTGEWNSKELIDRYGMSLIGGFVGGSLTNLGTNYQTMKNFNNMTSEQAVNELVHMIRNGEEKNLLRQINKIQVGNESLSTDYEIQGNNIVFSPGTKENNQDAYIKKAFKEQVKIIKNILDSNGAVSDSKFLDKQILDDLKLAALKKSVVAGRFLNEYNLLQSNLVRLVGAINGKINSVEDANNDGTITDREQRKAKLSNEDKKAVENLENELKETKQKIDDLVNGKRSYEFVADALFEMTSALSGNFAVTTLPLFAEHKFGRKYSELTEEEKTKAFNEYKEYKSNEGKDQLSSISWAYRKVAELSSKVIKDYEQKYLQAPKELTGINQVISNLYTYASQGHGLIDLLSIDDANQFLSIAQEIAQDESGLIASPIIKLIASEQEVNELKSILEKVNQIDPNLSREEKTKQSDNIANEQKLVEVLAKNSQNLIQPFVDMGFVNAETKNQLLKVLKTISNSVRIKQNEFEEQLENLPISQQTNAVNPYIEPLNQIIRSIRTVDSLSETPIEKSLNEFTISIGENPVNLTQLIERLNNAYNDHRDDITNFVLDDQLEKELNSAIFLLQLYQAAIRGARTDNADLNNLFGYNVTLNEIADKLGENKYPKLAEIDKNVADAFDQDIQVNLNKLLYLKKLYITNRGQKLSRQDRVSVRKDLLIYKRLKYLVQIDDKDPLKEWEGFAALQAAITGMVQHQKLLENNSNVVDESVREEFEREKIAAENAIYDFFQIESNKQKLKDPSKLSDFINPSKLQLYTEAKELLDENLEHIDDNAFVWWLSTRVALRAQDFYYQFKQIIDPNAKNPLAPIPTQELAIYGNYASIINGSVFTNFYKAFRYSMVEDWKSKTEEERLKICKRLGKYEPLASNKYKEFALNFLPVPRYQNIILTEGAPGTGKTTGVYQPTLALLKKFHPEVLSNVLIAHGANSTSAENLRNDLELDEKNSKALGLEEAMKEINPSWKQYHRDEDNVYQIPTSDYKLTDENEIKSNLEVVETSKPFSLIIIDEVSKFTAYDLDQIDEYAKKYGITVLVAGDFDQSGVIGRHTLPTINEFKGLSWDISLGTTNFIRSAPKLGVSMRTDNSIKTGNIQTMQVYMRDPQGICTFNYYEDETGLYGDKVISYGTMQEDDFSVEPILAEVKKMIDTLTENPKTGKKNKIGYIYSDKTSPVFIALSTNDAYKNYIDFREGGSAQGLEGQYYIIEANADFNKTSPNQEKSYREEYLKDIYTGISRAQQGSILIAPFEYKGVKFNSVQVSEKFDEGISKEAIAKYSIKRKELLDAVVKEGQVLSITPRETSESKSKVPMEKTGGLQPGIDSTPPAPKFTDEEKIALLQEMENADDIADLDNILQKIQDSNPDLRNDPGVIETYKRLYDELTSTPKSNPAIEIDPQINTHNVVSVSHEELVAKYGDKLNINKFTITINDVTIPLTLDQIPFVTRDMPSMQLQAGSSNIINHYGRNLVVDNINGFHQPFYMSTGKGGKATVAKGRWYPFLGINQEGWFNKGNEKQINDYYGSSILQAIAEKLNEELGTDLEEEMMGPPTPAVFREGFVNPVLDFINQDMHPVINNTATTIEQVNNNIKETVEIIQNKVDELINKIYTPTNVKLTEPLIYEEDEAPLINTDIINEDDYKQQIDESNESKNIPESTVEVTDKLIKIENMLLHSFNSFEIGVAIDNNGYPVSFGSQQYMDARIDSVNGLIKIDKLLNHPIRKVQEYVQILGQLRNVFFNTKDKSEIIDKIQRILDIRGIYCTFAIKSSPRIDRKKPKVLTDGYFGKPTPLVKNINEETLYNGSTDLRSQEWNQKSIVAIIGNETDGNILELPLLMTSSPFTLLQTQVDGAAVFGPMLVRFHQLIKQGLSFHEISETLVKEFRGNSQFEELVDLFELYNFADGGVFYINDTNWTPAGSLRQEGPHVITDAGFYQIVPGFSMNDFIKPESEWQTLNDFAKGIIPGRQETDGSTKNPVCYVTQKVMVSKYGTIDDVDKRVINPGHPFVLLSFDKDINTDSKVIQQFKRQMQNPAEEQKVLLMYVLPPKVPVREWFENVHKILNDDKSFKFIGNLFTSYRLLEVLMKNDNFKTRLEQKLKGSVAAIEKALSILRGKSIAEQRNILYSTQDWTNIGGLGVRKLAGLFDAALVNFAYDRRTIGETKSFNLNENDMTTIEQILSENGINSVYHRVRIAPGGQVIEGGFYIPDQGPNYTIDGKPFMIHGKVDSYTFSGYVGSIVKSALAKIRPGNNGMKYSTDTLSYMIKDPNSEIYLPGNSNLKKSTTFKTKEQSDAERLVTNTNKYLKSKTGTDYSEFFKTNTFEKALDLAITDINQANNSRIAFRIGNDVFISYKSKFLENSVVKIWGENGSFITDISQLLDNNGNYYFEISLNSDYSNTYSCVYNSKTKELEITQPIEQNSESLESLNITLTPENFEEYINQGREILESVFDDDFMLKDIFDVTTYDEFAKALENMIYIDTRSDLLKNLLPSLNEMQQQIVQDLININEFNNPFKENENENEEICPSTITIKILS